MRKSYCRSLKIDRLIIILVSKLIEYTVYVTYKPHRFLKPARFLFTDFAYKNFSTCLPAKAGTFFNCAHAP